MLGEIDRIAVGIENSVFGFAVGRPLVDAGGCVEILARFPDGADVFDFEAEMVDAGLQLWTFDCTFRADGDVAKLM